MFDRFFADPILAQEVADRLGDWQVSPATWQSYLQRQIAAKTAASNCDFQQLASQ
jgi:cytochrome oxidase assembly protein ShyY1